MSGPFDVIIVGAGGMGSAAAYHLASRGLRVLALEQFEPGHRWATMLGFEREGLMRAFGQDGSDMVMYSRIQ